MILHASIALDNPATAADFLARIWDGEAFPFHPVHGAFIVLKGDEAGSAIEIYPTGTVNKLGKDGISFEIADVIPQATATHLAVTTELDEQEVFALADSYSWWSRLCDRGDFSLIEIWMEGTVLVEIFTPAHLEAYREAMDPENWRDGE